MGFQTQIIPNFIEIAHYPFKERTNIRPHILWVRSFHQIYNPKMAIEVVKKLKKTYPDVTLTMIGPDKDGSKVEVEKLIKKENLANLVTLKGKMSKQEWIQLADNSDVFINTTNFDNQPVSIIEAMALGFPIVSTNAGGMPYLIDDGETGLLVNKMILRQWLTKLID
jgi:glycosyltransferase involved in cell wall biosynthesis